jgi:hypothetical protein
MSISKFSVHISTLSISLSVAKTSGTLRSHAGQLVPSRAPLSFGNPPVLSAKGDPPCPEVKFTEGFSGGSYDL